MQYGGVAPEISAYLGFLIFSKGWKTMKKVVLLMVCGLVLMVAGSVLAKSEWAMYQMNPIPEDVKVPQVAVYYVDGEAYLDCCTCHGPDVKHAGPKFIMSCTEPE